MPIYRGSHRVAVVLDDEQDRAHAALAPQPGHVHRLMERADVHGAVAEVADGDALSLAIPQRVRGAGGQCQMSTDDAVAAVEAMLDVEQMHRAALALGDAG